MKRTRIKSGHKLAFSTKNGEVRNPKFYNNIRIKSN